MLVRNVSLVMLAAVIMLASGAWQSVHAETKPAVRYARAIYDTHDDKLYKWRDTTGQENRYAEVFIVRADLTRSTPYPLLKRRSGNVYERFTISQFARKAANLHKKGRVLKAVINAGYFDPKTGGNLSFIYNGWSQRENYHNPSAAVIADKPYVATRSEIRFFLLSAPRIVSHVARGAQAQVSIQGAGKIVPWDSNMLSRESVPNTGFVTRAGQRVPIRRARTIVGYAGTTLYLVAVNEKPVGWRDPEFATTGVTAYQASRIMNHLGVAEALLLDGGGSTQMWVHTKGVVSKNGVGGVGGRSERGVVSALAIFAVP